MTDPVRVSAWTQATSSVPFEIRCPNPACLATNRPGVHFVDELDDGTALCNSCCKVWTWRVSPPS